MINTGKLQKALFLYNMNRFKSSVKPETKARHEREVLRAALELYEANDDILFDENGKRIEI